MVTGALTQHTSTTLIRSEKSDNILEGFVKTVLPFQTSSLQTQIKVYTAPGLSSLIKNPKMIQNHNITLETGRFKNKNKVLQVDRRIQEREDELRKLSAEEEVITEETLAKATKATSANEVLFCRKQDQQEINITDEQFASKIENFWTKNHQSSSKSKAKLKAPAQTPSLEVGQLVYLKQEITKHTARQLYIVMSDIKDNLVLIKKILHFHLDKPAKFLNLEHTVKPSDLIPITSKPKKVYNNINTW